MSHCLRAATSRRRFVTGVAAGGALAALGAWSQRSAAQSATTVELAIAELPVDFTGRLGVATAVNGSVPAPTLRWREGDDVAIRVANRLTEPTSIHWHGIVLPWQMDGVPGISFDGIAPGAAFTYRFALRQSGTYWYHSHSGFQEQTGLYGALIIDPAGPEPFAFEREHVVMLSEWTDEDPRRIYARLKKYSHYYNLNRRTLGDIRADIRDKGYAANREARRMWNQMRMSDRDLADVTGATYTYLVNGRTPAGNWTGLFERGERVRLRFINGSAMTIFDVRIPGLEMTVVAADGQNVEPVTIDEFRIGVAETYDVVVRPRDDTAYTIFAQSIDRSGYARGTLAPAVGLVADVPALDLPPVLTLADMGMGGMSAASTESAAADDGAVDHDAPAHGAPDHAAADPSAVEQAAAGHGAADHIASGEVATDHSAMGHAAAAPVVAEPDGAARVGVDMRAVDPQPRLDDPGVGLRSRDWRVLTYGALRRLRPVREVRDPSRGLELRLTGNMARYMWSFDGIRFADAEPIALTLGERVRITLINDTMMNHPIHLHGLWSDLETGGGDQYVRKHTVLVQPGQRVSYDVDADAPGPWAYHCHLLYHMEAGMFRVVSVA